MSTEIVTPERSSDVRPALGMPRRWFLLKLGVVLNGVVASFLIAPIVRYLLSPVKSDASYKTWISLGALDGYPVGETRLATFVNPFRREWDGETAGVACYVRRTSADKFQVFAVNCAHLGCPVRWFPQSQLFMCPCHGGAYYADGSRASGPPERGLFTYEYKVDGNQLHINAGQMPTLANTAKLVTIEKREDSRLATTPSGTLDGRKRNTRCAS
jgi:Rieske Fe-S protein